MGIILLSLSTSGIFACPLPDKHVYVKWLYPFAAIVIGGAIFLGLIGIAALFVYRP
jgi:hypothetical protein